MKKRISVLILLFALSISAVSCKKKEEPSDVIGEDQTAEEETSEQDAGETEEESSSGEIQQEAPAAEPMQSEESFTLELEEGAEGTLAPD